MACDLNDILNLATELSESTHEINIRTSISKSYYFTYHSCLSNLGITDTRDWVGGSGGVHGKLSDHYLYSVDKAIGYMLMNLKAKRHLADYDLSKNFDQNDAKAAIKSASQLIERLKEI